MHICPFLSTSERQVPCNMACALRVGNQCAITVLAQAQAQTTDNAKKS